MAKDVDVTIVAKTVGGKIEFEMEQKNQYTEILVFNKTKDNMKKSEHYHIVFKLDDQTTAGLRFDAAKPIYISKGSDKHLPKCPMNGNAGGPNEFSVVGTPTNDTLTVRNDDMNESFYKFVLNFLDSSGNRHVFDPIFGNQNGGMNFTSPGTVATGAVSGAAAAIAISLLSPAATVQPLLMNLVVGALIGIVAAVIVGALVRRT